MINLTINNTIYPYPEVGDENWGDNATRWAAAVTTGMLQKSGGLFQLLAEVDFGTQHGLKSLYFKSRSTNPATAGVLRLANTDTISFRNAANSANLALGVNGSNQLTFNGSTVAIGNFIPNVPGSVLLTNIEPISTGILGYNGIGTSSPAVLSFSQVLSGLSVFTGDSGSGGTKGLVPAPSAGDAAAGKFLKADGTWATGGGGITQLNGDISAGPGTGNVTATINNSAVTSSKIAANSIGSAHIVDTAVTNTKLATNSVTTGKIADGSVVSTKLMNDAVITIKIQDSAITTAKINDLAVTAAKVLTNTLTLNKIQQIADNSILGNLSGATGDVQELTPSAVTAVLDNFLGDGGSGGVKGLVPAPSSGDGANKFLKANGTWAVPPGTPITPNNTNSINLTYSSPNLSADLNLSASSAPASNQLVTLSIQSDGLRAVIPNASIIAAIPNASASTTGLLTSTDWNTFNSKQAAGNYVTSLTGDVTGSGPGATATTIAAAAVTLSKMANLAANSFIGNNTGVSATPLALTTTQATAMLNSFVGDTGSGGVKGLVPAPASGDALKYLRGDGTWQTVSGGSGITQLTGDVTAGPGSGSQAATIANGAVTLAKMANLASNSLIGNNTGGSAAPVALLGSQVTAMLDPFVGDSGIGGVQGVVPAPAPLDGFAGKFLKADGTWAVPAGGGGSSSCATPTNLLGNGNFRTCQGTDGSGFSTSSAITTSTTGMPDMWTGSVSSSTGSLGINSQSTAVINGVTSYYTQVSPSASAALAATNYAMFSQAIESTMFTNWLGKNIVVGFDVYCTVTGTASVILHDILGNKSYAVDYTVTSAATWERKYVRIPVTAFPSNVNAATSTSAVARLNFSFRCGSNNAVATGSWVSSQAMGSTTMTDFLDTAGNVARITNVIACEDNDSLDLEPAFNYYGGSYDSDLLHCQRYFATSFAQRVVPGTTQNAGAIMRKCTSTAEFVDIFFPVEMRANPTMTYTGSNGGANAWRDQGASVNVAMATVTSPIATLSTKKVTVSGTTTIGNVITGHYRADARIV